MIILPTRFESKLKTDKLLYGSLLQTFSVFEHILQWSKLPFFPEYTDHGEAHLTSVLRTADALIPDDSRSHVSVPDAAVLTLAVLLHDLGMHLNEDGFARLVSSKN